MQWLRMVGVAVCLASLTACSFQNKNEREADKITRAVMNNDLAPVKDDLAPNLNVTRVQVAQWADELDAQGKLQSVKETTAACPVGVHCFDVTFERAKYLERMRLDENGKVVGWQFHRAANS